MGGFPDDQGQILYCRLAHGSARKRFIIITASDNDNRTRMPDIECMYAYKHECSVEYIQPILGGLEIAVVTLRILNESEDRAGKNEY